MKFKLYVEPRGNKLKLQDLDEFGENKSVAVTIRSDGGYLSPYGATFDLTPSQQRDVVIELIEHLMLTDTFLVDDVVAHMRERGII
jgi:hypothetical protein